MSLKSAILVTLVSLSSSVVYAEKPSSKDKKKSEEKVEEKNSHPKDPYLKLADEIQQYAKQFMNTHYVWGGKKPGGFDCSGLVRFCYKKFGMELTQGSAELFKMGYEIPPLGALPGDMIFFRRGSNPKSQVSHVGMVVEVTADNRVKFIHAARTQGVIYSFLDEDYYKNHFAGVKRVIDGLKNYKY